jgi:hypothetical protein
MSDKSKWDSGQKLFQAKFPEMIGYCGDVLLSINIISTLIYLIDNEIIYKNIEKPSVKNQKAYEYIVDKFMEYPKKMNTTIVHIIKDRNNIFKYYEINYDNQSGKWFNKEVDLTLKSSFIDVYGSGKVYYEDKRIKYSKVDIMGTSRFYYNVLVETIAENNDKFTGGAPQIVALYGGDKSHRSIGVIWKEDRYLNGVKIDNDYDNSKIDWLNERFERINYNDFKLVGQKQPWSRMMNRPTWLKY